MTDSFTGTPNWYGGSEGIIRRLADRSEQIFREPYRPYQFPKNYNAEERIAPFSPLQEEGFQQAKAEATDPTYGRIFGQAAGTVTNALGQNVVPQILPYIQRATANPTEAAREYMNPYQEGVINQIGKYGSRNLTENILPNVQDRFIQAGQYGSSQHQTLANRAIRDTQEAVTDAQSRALQGGYDKALNTAQIQQERQLQGGQLLGGAAGRDIEHKIYGGRELQNLGESQQQARQRGIGFLSQIGGMQQGQHQNVLNTAHEDFQKATDYPAQQLARQNAILRGLPVGETQSQRSYLPTPPSASPWSQGAGIVGQLAGAFGQRQGYAQGGHVEKHATHIRHYADGGGVPNNPIQLGVNDALDTTEINLMREQAARLAQPQINPFWASVAKAGTALASDPYARPGFSKIGQALGQGIEEYQGQLANQDKRGIEANKIHNMIDSTLRWQNEANRKHSFELEKFGHEKEIDKEKLGIQRDQLGIHQGQLGLAKERLAIEKDLYEKGLKGSSKKSSGPDLFSKSNQAAIEESRKTISTLPALKSNLNQLKGLAEKLDTGPTKGRIAQTSSTLGSLAGVGSAQDIDAFDSLTNSLVLDLGNQLKGSQVALGKLKIIEQSKPQLTKVKGGNIEIINHMKDLTDLAEQKAKFMSKALKSSYNAIDVENAFNQYADAKLEYEEKGEKFPNKPEDFLQAIDEEENSGRPSIDLSSFSEDELERIGGE